MTQIKILDHDTIDKIAAGEVVERPASVVKELVENSIDAGARAVTVELREGGTKLIRVTDNGRGIGTDDVRTAFLRHATSKIRTIEDLCGVGSLGFRGEALSSIAAVARVELVTKTAGSLTGVRYLIEGAVEKGFQEVGAPDGTTFLIRNLFYNTPARLKFLKSPGTEGGHVSALMERLALSRPDISFKFINNGKVCLQTSGNGELREVIYQIYGRDVISELIALPGTVFLAEPGNPDSGVTVEGYIGTPAVSRGNRAFENYFVNRRCVNSVVVTKAVEDGYKSFLMQHRYPFAVLHIGTDGRYLDVNVHPAKLEVRFSCSEGVYEGLKGRVRDALLETERIPQTTAPGEERKTLKPPAAVEGPEPFETKRREREGCTLGAQPAGSAADRAIPESPPPPRTIPQTIPQARPDGIAPGRNLRLDKTEEYVSLHGEPFQPEKEEEPEISLVREPKSSYLAESASQMTLFEPGLLTEKAREAHRIIGQVFGTYWLVEYDGQLFIIDQHAAHEKVLYERMKRALEKKEMTSQQISPPVIVTLTDREAGTLDRYMEHFTELGFEVEPFGGNEYSIRAVPDNLYGIENRQLFTELLDSLMEEAGSFDADGVSDRIASMACKAAVKGNQRLSEREAAALIDELLLLENPYNCPHGRPTIIRMSRRELERKFKRIL